MTTSPDPAAEAAARGATSDAALVTGLADGDKSAFERLYDRHVRAVYAYAMTHLETRQDAEEVAQDVFVTLWQRRRSIELPGDSVLPWLIVTCRNKVLNRRRAVAVHERRRSGDADPVELPVVTGPEHEAERRELHRQIDRAVSSLGETDRTVFELCIVEGRSYDDVARITGTTNGSVRNRLSRLRARLRDELETLRGSSS